MLALFLTVAFVLVFGLFCYIVTRPAAFRIERSALIGAPPEKVFDLIDNLRAWEQWSPWDKIDPALQRTYSGPAAGAGAGYHWLGNKQVGEGRMTILDSARGRHIAIKLEFIKPFAATNDCRFELKPEGSGTRVSWSMAGNHNLMGKAFSAFCNMDKMVGADFEKGLAQLDAAAKA